MTSHNPLANMMSKMLNAETVGKAEVRIHPFSKTAQEVLEILKTKGYIEDYKLDKERPGSGFSVLLSGKINKCGVVSPNFNVKKDGYEVWEKRFLPAKGFGILLVTTTKGIMTHEEAKEKELGGRLIGYCY